MQLKIEKIERESKVSKAGKNYVSIKVIANGGRWYTGFGDEINKNWKEGDTVEAPVYTEEYNGKTYSKLGLPKNPTELQQINSKLDTVIAMLSAKKKEKEIEEIFNVKENNDLPF